MRSIEVCIDYFHTFLLATAKTTGIMCLHCGHLSVPLWRTQYLMNAFREYLQIWHKHPLTPEDELIRFWKLKVKVTLTSQNAFWAVTQEFHKLIITKISLMSYQQQNGCILYPLFLLLKSLSLHCMHYGLWRDMNVNCNMTGLQRNTTPGGHFY